MIIVTVFVFIAIIGFFFILFFSFSLLSSYFSLITMLIAYVIPFLFKLTLVHFPYINQTDSSNKHQHQPKDKVDKTDDYERCYPSKLHLNEDQLILYMLTKNSQVKI
jgi:hypothetical protein